MYIYLMQVYIITTTTTIDIITSTTYDNKTNGKSWTKIIFVRRPKQKWMSTYRPT